MIDDAFSLSPEDVHQFFDLTPDPVLAHQRGVILFVNQAFARSVGQANPSRLSGRNVIDLIAPEDRDRISKLVREPDPRAVRPVVDVRYLHEDGSHVILQGAGMRIGPRDRPITVLVCRDVTRERAQTEELRRANEERQLVFEGGPIGVTHTDSDGRFVFANPAFCTLLGYTEKELRGLIDLDLTHADDRRDELKALRSLWTGASRASFHKRITRKDGASVECSVLLSLMRDKAGEPRGYISHVLDNTAEIRAAEALKAAEEQFRALFEQAPIAMGITSLTEGRGYFQKVNPSMCKQLGYSEAELLETPLSQLVDPVDNDTDIDRLSVSQLRVGEQYQVLKRYRVKSGAQILVERFITPVGGARGKPIALMVQGIDVTTQRSVETALREQVAALQAELAAQKGELPLRLVSSSETSVG